MSNEWDRAAEEYGQLIGEHGDVWRQILINPAITQALQKLPVGSRILDLGCGEGYLARVLAKYGWQYVGVDSSQQLLKIAAAKNSPGEFELGDITKPLNYASNFDAVIANMVLMDVDNMGGAYQNAWRCLRTNGMFVITLPHPVFRRPGAILAKTLWAKIFRRDPFVRVNAYTQGFFQRGRLASCQQRTTVFHRPLAKYIQIPLIQGFVCWIYKS